MTAAAPGAGWERAVARAGEIAAADRQPALCTDRHWDWVAIRGLLAVVLQALAAQGRRSVDDVPLEEVLQHCDRGPEHLRGLAVPLVGERLAYALDTDPGTVEHPADPPISTWLWLTRTWPRVPWADAPGPAQYDGMLRGISLGHPGAAVDVLPGWAARAVAASMADSSS
ncbi:hypothetical protein ABT039_22700 [Streptomyces lasiicapitis]|uniref:hypothetical protein n=1 Tax=Streptomyces lasiicapitis TaxID=1923961 RepID=UPI00331BFB33